MRLAISWASVFLLTIPLHAMMRILVPLMINVLTAFVWEPLSFVTTLICVLTIHASEDHAFMSITPLPVMTVIHAPSTISAVMASVLVRQWIVMTIIPVLMIFANLGSALTLQTSLLVTMVTQTLSMTLAKTVFASARNATAMITILVPPKSAYQTALASIPTITSLVTIMTPVLRTTHALVVCVLVFLWIVMTRTFAHKILVSRLVSTQLSASMMTQMRLVMMAMCAH